MKQKIALLFLLAALSAYSGHLMSKASWVGRVGMTFFHREYNLLKIWWQGAAAVFIVILAVFAVHEMAGHKLHYRVALLVHLLLLLAACGGAYLTYDDFNNNLSHHILGHRFHNGFYLAWGEWILVSMYFLLKRRPVSVSPTDTGKTEPAVH